MATSNPKYVQIVKDDFHILSKAYDLINNFMSLGTDQTFRYIAIKNLIAEHKEEDNLRTFIDIGTGTGHLANELHRQKPGSYVIGLDVSLSMINYSKEREISQEGLMDLVLGDAAKLPFRKGGADGLFSGFVGRHFTNYPKTLIEHNRILRKNGRLCMLEMGRRATILSPIIDVYVGNLMGLLGRLATFIVTRGKAPFRLLEETYARYHSPKELLQLYQGAGFKTWYKLGLMGSIVVLLAKKN